MAITEFGRIVRQFREKEEVSLRQMAEEIGFSATYLSAVEMGEKGITDDLVDKVVGFFRKRGRKTKDLASLTAAVDRTRRTVNVSQLDGQSRAAVVAFARNLADLDKESREKFLKKVGFSGKSEEE
ncbi:MAG: helix-turn-helix transcriptional regulator [Betaproteobacteria bacterium]|nr:helix-turn-helix transcriptional regulator [Betaproteobacteria bacterium]